MNNNFETLGRSRELSAMLAPYRIPKVAKVHITFNNDILEDPKAVLQAGLEAKCDIKPGEEIAITCGSRGIDGYLMMVQTIVEFVKSKGGVPFLVPSMGSHGGATAEGQIEMLRGYGITEESTGAPIRSSMETVQIGVTPKGLPVLIDKNAYNADGIILLNRVKPHTSFRGKYESGLLKMLAIGLAKQKGAEQTHFLGFDNMAESVENVGKIGMATLKIKCGVCTIENGYGKIADLHVENAPEIVANEPGYLQDAWKRMPRLPMDAIDTLIMKEIGKDISGPGMDTNIIGRYHSNAASGGPKVKKLGILNSSVKSEGNANGMGLSDFMPRHMLEGIDFVATYMNTLTSTEPNSTRMPMVLANDREVFQACIKCCSVINPDDAKLVIAENTKHIDILYMSEAAVKAAIAEGHVKVDVLSEYEDVPFDADGNMMLFK